MKTKPFFPALPANLTVKELRIEIKNRLEISEKLSLIQKPRK